jgi:hypothetical protein
VDKKLFSRLLESVKQADEIVRGERAPARKFVVDAAQVRCKGSHRPISSAVRTPHRGQRRHTAKLGTRVENADWARAGAAEGSQEQTRRSGQGIAGRVN